MSQVSNFGHKNIGLNSIIQIVDAGTFKQMNNVNGVFNFYDVSTYIASFISNYPLADLNNDAQWDIFDVDLFLDSVAAGCP